jgi:hypothetical protein
MSTLAKTGRALLTEFGLALVAALALTTGCASEDAADAQRPAGEASSAYVMAAADAEDRDVSSVRSAPVGIFTCVLEGGRPGSIVVFRGPFMHNPCAIASETLPGSSKMFCDDEGCLRCKYLQTKWDCPLL